jgi:hypothetical protein
MTGNRERVALACFVAGALLAGGNGVSIRFSNRELPPLWGAGLRFSLAAALLLVIMAVLRLPFPRGRALTGALLYGALNFGAAFALAYYALVRLHAGLGQTLLALVPLATLLLAVAQGQDACGLRRSSAPCSHWPGSASSRRDRWARRCRWARCWPRWPARCASRKPRCWCAGSLLSTR